MRKDKAFIGFTEILLCWAVGLGTLSFFRVADSCDKIDALQTRISYVEDALEESELKINSIRAMSEYSEEVIKNILDRMSDGESVDKIPEEETVEVAYIPDVGKDVELPDLPTSRKVCTDYRVYNIKGTPHNRMQMVAHTDALGCRRYGGHYIVGLGSAYADRIGEVFEVELDTGIIFTVITGDMKADCDTDVTNRYALLVDYNGRHNANILEFIIDKEAFSSDAYKWGGVDYYDKFKGNIVRMTYIGRNTDYDWDIYT